MNFKSKITQVIANAAKPQKTPKRKDVIDFFASKILQAAEDEGIDVGQVPDVPVPDLSQSQDQNNEGQEPSNEGQGNKSNPAKDNGDAPKDLSQGKQISKIDDMPANKQAYFINLALRDVKNIIDVANFNLKDGLKKQRPVITDVYFDRNGSGSVDVVIPFEYSSEEEEDGNFSNVTGAFDLELRSEYKDLVSYKVITPTYNHPEVSVEITITIPKALMKDIGVGNFDTRTKVLTKYVENLVRKELM